MISFSALLADPEPGIQMIWRLQIVVELTRVTLLHISHLAAQVSPAGAFWFILSFLKRVVRLIFLLNSPYLARFWLVFEFMHYSWTILYVCQFSWIDFRVKSACCSYCVVTCFQRMSEAACLKVISRFIFIPVFIFERYVLYWAM